MSGLPPQVDYSRSINEAARYKILQTPPSNNVQSVFKPSPASTKYQWTLPAGIVINPKRTTLAYAVEVNAQGAGNFSFFVDDCFQI